MAAAPILLYLLFTKIFYKGYYSGAVKGDLLKRGNDIRKIGDSNNRIKYTLLQIQKKIADYFLQCIPRYKYPKCGGAIISQAFISRS